MSAPSSFFYFLSVIQLSANLIHGWLKCWQLLGGGGVSDLGFKKKREKDLDMGCENLKKRYKENWPLLTAKAMVKRRHLLNRQHFILSMHRILWNYDMHYNYFLPWHTKSLCKLVLIITWHNWHGSSTNGPACWKTCNKTVICLTTMSL